MMNVFSKRTGTQSASEVRCYASCFGGLFVYLFVYFVCLSWQPAQTIPGLRFPRTFIPTSHRGILGHDDSLDQRTKN